MTRGLMDCTGDSSNGRYDLGLYYPFECLLWCVYSLSWIMIRWTMFWRKIWQIRLCTLKLWCLTMVMPQARSFSSSKSGVVFGGTACSNCRQDQVTLTGVVHRSHTSWRILHVGAISIREGLFPKASPNLRVVALKVVARQWCRPRI